MDRPTEDFDTSGFSDSELVELLTERIGEVEQMQKEFALHDLAFVIHRFCGGKISYTVEEIQKVHLKIDIIRTYVDGCWCRSRVWEL